MKYMGLGTRRRIFTFISVVGVFALAGILFLVLSDFEKRSQKEQQFLFEMDEEYYQKDFFTNEETDDNVLPDVPAYDLYEKIKAKSEVNVLFLGDEVAKGLGVSNAADSFVNMLVENWESEYGVDIKGGNYARPDTDSFYGYYIMNSYSRNLIYDLFVICYGAKDETKDFEFYYDGLLRSIKNQNPKCEIVCIIEACQDGYNENSAKIKAICENYGGICVDMVEYFSENSIRYSEATKDGYLPNELGCRAYYDAVWEAVDENYKSGRKVPEKTAPLLASSKKFDSFKFVKLSEMTKISDTEYEYKTETAVAGIIYYRSYFGKDLKLYVNGKKTGEVSNKMDVNVARQIQSKVISNSIQGKVKIKVDASAADNVSNIVGIVLCDTKNNGL